MENKRRILCAQGSFSRNAGKEQTMKMSSSMNNNMNRLFNELTEMNRRMNTTGTFGNPDSLTGSFLEIFREADNDKKPSLKNSNNLKKKNSGKKSQKSAEDAKKRAYHRGETLKTPDEQDEAEYADAAEQIDGQLEFDLETDEDGEGKTPKPSEDGGCVKTGPQKTLRTLSGESTHKKKESRPVIPSIHGLHGGGRYAGTEYGCPDAVNLQDAMAWAEILGDPVSKKRRRRRVSQQYGNQGNVNRR
jgi:hypothetical protein